VQCEISSSTTSETLSQNTLSSVWLVAICSCHAMVTQAALSPSSRHRTTHPLHKLDHGPSTASTGAETMPALNKSHMTMSAVHIKVNMPVIHHCQGCHSISGQFNSSHCYCWILLELCMQL
jgi:hypothetical protein